MSDLISLIAPVETVNNPGASRTLTFKGPGQTQYNIQLNANCVFTIDTATALPGTGIAPQPGMSMLLVIKGPWAYRFNNVDAAYGAYGPPIPQCNAFVSDLIEVLILANGDLLIRPHEQAALRGQAPSFGLQPLDSQWRGKSAVWFGTSIPAGGFSTGSYVTRVASILGMTIANEAVGSSPARNGVAALRNGSADPYGWAGLPWQNVAYALAGSLAEKNDLIANWSSKYRALLTNSPPETLDAGAQAQFRDCSYENKLVVRHLGANRKDLYVFDHGHNDWAMNAAGTAAGAVSGGDGDMTYMPANTRDRGTFLGAINFLVDLILSDNPKARLVFIGHYEDARKKNISEGQTALAARWDFPMVPLWSRLGWSQETIKTGPAAGLTMTQIWMPDDLHPHTDTSASSTNLIASVLAAAIRDVR